MKYTINQSKNKIQGKTLKLGKYISLADIGEGWITLPQSNKQYFFTRRRKTICTYTEYTPGLGRTQHRRLVEVRENGHKLESREYRRYRLAKDATNEYILEIAEAINGISWEHGTQCIRIYAQRPRHQRKNPKATAHSTYWNGTAFGDRPRILPRSEWDEFQK